MSSTVVKHFRVIKNKFKLGPGPGAYMLPPTVGYPDHDARKYRLPQYSFGKRPVLIDKRLSPGPGAYVLGKVTRYGPAHSNEYSMAQILKPLRKLNS